MRQFDNDVRILNFDTNVTPEQLKEQFENIFNGIGDYYDDTRSYQARRQQSSLYTASDRRSLYQAWENRRSDLRQSGAVFGDGSLLAEAKARNEQFQREQERAKLKKQATAAESAADTTTPSTETTASTSTEEASTEPAVQAEWDRLFDERAEKRMGLDMSGYRKRIVPDQNTLREKVIIFDQKLDDRIIEIIKLIYYSNASK